MGKEYTRKDVEKRLYVINLAIDLVNNNKKCMTFSELDEKLLGQFGGDDNGEFSDNSYTNSRSYSLVDAIITKSKIIKDEDNYIFNYLKNAFVKEDGSCAW